MFSNIGFASVGYGSFAPDLSTLIAISRVRAKAWFFGSEVQANDVASLALMADGWLVRMRARHDTVDSDADMRMLADRGVVIARAFMDAGIDVPAFEVHTVRQICTGLLHYFSRITPFMRRGHDDFVGPMSRALADQAIEVVENLELEDAYSERVTRVASAASRHAMTGRRAFQL